MADSSAFPKAEIPVDQLFKTLRQHLEGEVSFDASAKALYARDASNYRQIPIGLIKPRHTQDYIRAIEICRQFQAPVLPRGAGTSLAGQACNFAVVIDTSRYLNRILEIHPSKNFAVVEPGVILDQLNAETARYGLTFGPDPATHSRCTIGGMIGNNACGVHSLRTGRMSENVEALEILTYDGVCLSVGTTSEREREALLNAGGRIADVYGRLYQVQQQYAALIRRKYPKISRRVSGYNLDELLPEKGFHIARSLVGTEGTCVSILSAKVRLSALPKHRVLTVVGFPDIVNVADAVPEALALQPSGLEGVDGYLVEHQKKLGIFSEFFRHFPEGYGWLFVEFAEEDEALALQKAEKLCRKLSSSHHVVESRIYRDPLMQNQLWKIRETVIGATVFVPGNRNTWPGWEDSAVPPAMMGGYLRELKEMMMDFGYEGCFYGHFGEGCLHARISFDFETEEGIRNYRAFIEKAADLVVSYGGSFSGEHGDGHARGELLQRMFGPELVQAFREYKSIWDPEGKMNPGKVVDAYSLTDHLRPPLPEASAKGLHFTFTHDHGNLQRAVSRCIGVGKCRQSTDGTMCPSYRATQDEKHSTRGRAHLLAEMLQGDIIKSGWQSEEVKDALDLCLSCKACKTECPTNVDMAAYKAEFLSHYYESKRRPLRAYAFGHIHRLAGIASQFPHLVNGVMAAPGLKEAVKATLGIASERQLPRFAARPFRKTLSRKSLPKNPDVILWADTFNNYFEPENLKAAWQVLELSGARPASPKEPFCCGRPYFDWGMIEEAKKTLQQTLDVLAPDLEKGIPLVVLEPGCASVFRDELLQLFPHDSRAKELKRQTYLFSEYMNRFALPAPKIAEVSSRVVKVFSHCHQKALSGVDADKQLWKTLGVHAGFPETGCCGMAGAFGYEKKHYDVSVSCANHGIVPVIHNSEKETEFVADGFSCREQIRQLCGQKVSHSVQLYRDLFLSKDPSVYF